MNPTKLSILIALVAISLARPAFAETPKFLTTPDKVESPLGTLEFKDGAPSNATVQKVYDNLDYIRGVDVFMNSFSGVSAYAIREGFNSIGAEDNAVVIFSELMDSKSLFLTANADTVYNLAVIDLSKGPMVVEVPPMQLGTLNDMWFGWIIDIGAPGPDRGAGGKYLIVPPGYDGLLPDSGFFVGHSKTLHVLYAVRAFMVNNDPKPAVEGIKKGLKIYPYTPGGFGTSIATALEGKARLAVNPPVPETKFVEGSGKSFNTIPPNDFGFFEMLRAEMFFHEPELQLEVGRLKTLMSASNFPCGEKMFIPSGPELKILPRLSTRNPSAPDLKEAFSFSGIPSINIPPPLIIPLLSRV